MKDKRINTKIKISSNDPVIKALQKIRFYVFLEKDGVRQEKLKVVTQSELKDVMPSLESAKVIELKGTKIAEFGVDDAEFYEEVIISE